MNLNLIYGPAETVCVMCGVIVNPESGLDQVIVDTGALCPECTMECEDVGINPMDVIRQGGL